MLELGKPGSGGAGRGVLPVLRDGEPVAFLSLGKRSETASAVIDDHTWTFRRDRKGCWGLRGDDPGDAARLLAVGKKAPRAGRLGWRRSYVHIDLEGTVVEMHTSRRALTFASNGQTLARGDMVGTWTLRPRLAVEGGMPLHHQLFLLWLVELRVRVEMSQG